MPSPTDAPASLPDRLADAEGELPEEIEQAIDALVDAEHDQIKKGSRDADAWCEAAGVCHRARAALTATILARLTAAHKERRDENGFVCEYDGSLSDDDYMVSWDKGARWIMVNRSGKITIGQSPSDGKPCVSTTWGDLLARLTAAESAREAARATMRDLHRRTQKAERFRDRHKSFNAIINKRIRDQRLRMAAERERDAALARAERAEKALDFYRSAAVTSATMEGLIYRGVSNSMFRHAWEADRAALAHPVTAEET